MSAFKVSIRVVDKQGLKSLFFQRVNPAFRTPWWMKRAYYDACRNERVMVAFPLNYVVSLAWFLNLKWGQFRHKPTWIDRLVMTHSGEIKP